MPITGKFTRGHTRASKITTSDVYAMRQKYASGVTQGSLAREYNLSVGQIGRIVRGESWNQFEYEGESNPEGAVASLSDADLDASAQRLMNKLNTDIAHHPISRNKELQSELDEWIDPSVPKGDS